MIESTKRKVISVAAGLAAAQLSFTATDRFHLSAKAAPSASVQMQRLQKFYMGTWHYTETYPKSPFAPNGGENTGIYRSELGRGGNSLINRFLPRDRSASLKPC